MATTPTRLEISGHSHPTDDTWILHFGYATNPLPMNGPKANWRGRARWTNVIKTQTLRQAIAAKIPECARVEAQLVWWIDVNRRRDVDNLAGLEKPMFDGLVVAGVVRDDTPDLMSKPRAEIRNVRDSDGLVTKPGFTLHVRRLAEVEEIEL
jgi:hypothetical protein